MFSKINRIFVLLIGNQIESCKEDVRRINILLEKYINSKLIITKIDVVPVEEINKFIEILPSDLNENDLLYIHYSGHGIKIGKKIEGKLDIITALKSPQKILSYSHNIDKILSKLKCKILLICDCCYSGNFTKYFTGTSLLLFIGSSSSVNLSREYNLENFEDFNQHQENRKAGILTFFLEYVLVNYNIKNLTIEILEKELLEFFKKYKIKHFPVLKIFNHQ